MLLPAAAVNNHLVQEKYVAVLRPKLLLIGCEAKLSHAGCSGQQCSTEEVPLQANNKENWELSMS